MKFCLLAFILLILLVSANLNAQTVSLIGTSEEFILEHVSGYSSVEDRGIEHEEFNVLVFQDTDRELSFYFTFYKGEKICNYIKSTAPMLVLKSDIEFIKTHFKNIRNNIWENASKTVQVQINDTDGMGLIVMKEIRN